jgi:predicted membrane protein
MISPWSTRRRLAVAAVLALLLGGTALLSSSVVVSYPMSSTVLGNQWECSSFAFFTTCTRVEMVTPVAHGLGRDLRGRPGV